MNINLRYFVVRPEGPYYKVLYCGRVNPRFALFEYEVEWEPALNYQYLQGTDHWAPRMNLETQELMLAHIG